MKPKVEEWMRKTAKQYLSPRVTQYSSSVYYGIKLKAAIEELAQIIAEHAPEPTRTARGEERR